MRTIRTEVQKLDIFFCLVTCLYPPAYCIILVYTEQCVKPKEMIRMIQQKNLKKMSVTQLNEMFQYLLDQTVTEYNLGILLHLSSGCPAEDAIYDLFFEMQQVWLQKLQTERTLKGGE